jgi:site-specific DNA recombinase
VARQEADCRELVAAREWTVSGVYVDDDRSAYSGKPRPAYDELIGDLRAGRIDAVVAWHPDRLHRSPRELEDFIDLVEANRAAVATVQTGEYDLGSASGRMTARVVGAVARAESEHKSERIRRQREQAAAAGQFHGGRRSFGYEVDGVTVVEAEAVLIREAAGRFLAGESLRAIAIDFNEREIPTASGGTWGVSSLRSVLSGPRAAGRRVFRGEDVGDAKWPAILSYEEHLRLRAMFGNPRLARRGRPPAHLLTSMVRCGRCSATMHTQQSAHRGRRYSCNHQPGRPGCGGTAVAAESLEQLITEAVFLRVDSPALARALARQAPRSEIDHAGDLAAIETQLEQVDHDFYVEGLIDRKRWLNVKGQLEGRRDAILAELTAHTRSTALDGYTTPGALRGAWPDLTVDQRRAILATLIDHVTINPATRSGRRFDTERVDVTWLV